MGLRFAFAHFINPRGGDAVTRAYRERFRPSARESAPAALVCVFVICAEDDAQAERLAASIDLRRLHMALNLDTPVPTLAEAEQHVYAEEERRYVRAQRERAVIGGPDTCRRELDALAERYAVDEVMALTITGDYATRLRSYELLAGAFELA
jgi:alkanesulfonate monooxygenase SsuD/methylene tetrahydromethanopterin reductase-like flavin-dependent oxidoreductase (luciferase family)